MRFLVATALSALALGAWALPAVEERAAAAAGKFTFYELPTPLSGPCDLTEGPDGALWGEDIAVNYIFRVDPATGKVTQYKIPFTTPLSNVTIPGVSQAIQDRTALSCAIRNGADGNIYASNGVRNQLVRINPTTKKIQVFAIDNNPAGNLQPFNDIYTAKDGIWLTQTTANTFAFFSFATEQFTIHNVPTPLAVPLGLYVASDGVVYIAELVANKILTYNPQTKATHEYPLRLGALPGVIRAEHAGYVYFTLFTGDGLGRISMTNGSIDYYPTTAILAGLGSENTVDSKGCVWLSYFNENVMAKLDTTTYKYTYIPFPDTFASVDPTSILGIIPPNVDIAVNYGPGDNIWFTSVLKNSVGRYALS